MMGRVFDIIGRVSSIVIVDVELVLIRVGGLGQLLLEDQQVSVEHQQVLVP